MSFPEPVHRLGLVPALLLALALGACGDAPAGGDEAEAPAPGPASAAANVDTPGRGAIQPATAGPAAPAPQAPETVILKVNGREVTQGELDSELVAQYPMLRANNPQFAGYRAKLIPQALESLISMALLKGQAEKEGLGATPADVDAEWSQIVARVKQQRPGMDIATLLAQQHTTEAEVREQLAGKIAIDRLLKKHAPPSTKIADEQVRANYEQNAKRYTKPAQVRARHILLMTNQPGVTEEVKAERKKKLEDLRAKIVADGGKGFAAAAKEHSDCPTCAKGGDLDYFPATKMVPPFSKAAFAAEVGEITEVVETGYGYHLIKVEDKKPAVTTPFEEAAPAIRQELEQRAAGEAQRAYVKTLRDAATIERPNEAR